MRFCNICRIFILPLIIALIVPLAAALSSSPAIAQDDSRETQTDEPEKKKDPYRERLGLRAGYVGTSNSLGNAFGGGLDLSLHWVQRVKYPLAIDVTIGAFYLGSTGREDITVAVFNQLFDNVSMRVLHITVAPMLEMGVGERTHLFVQAGGGLYRVSVLVDRGFSEADFSNSHFGVVGGIGLIRRISDSWFFDMSFQAHKFWTGSEFDDFVFRYSEGDGNPVFYNATIGLMLRLF